MLSRDIAGNHYHSDSLSHGAGVQGSLVQKLLGKFSLQVHLIIKENEKTHFRLALPPPTNKRQNASWHPYSGLWLARSLPWDLKIMGVRLS